MGEFVSSALPCILAGIALAILAVNYSKEKKKDEKQGFHIATGMGLGLIFGVALNNCGLWENHILGIVLGLLWGMALGTLFENKKKKEKD